MTAPIQLAFAGEFKALWPSRDVTDVSGSRAPAVYNKFEHCRQAQEVSMRGCEKFRFMAEADPGHLTWHQRLHKLTCRTCERYLALMRRLDDQIRKALELEFTATPLRSTRYRSKLHDKESGCQQESAD